MTGRAKRFAAGLFTSYAALVVNIFYTALSVPLALHYLGKEQFGLWALALQVSGYMGLLELGMSSAISRFLADHKDDVNGGEYGSLLLTSGIVFVIQGAMIAIAGAVFSYAAPGLFHIPPALASDFRCVLVMITSISGFSTATRSLGGPLWAFQRGDISYLLAIMTLVVGYGVMWLGFRAGYGIYSLAYASIPAAMLSPVILCFICLRNGYYPARGSWGRPQGIHFKKLFSFGMDVLMMSVGSQLVNASQIMILSRLAGLDAAATFSVGTKLYTMGQQLVWKVLDNSAPALTEIFISGDTVRFNERFWNVVSLTAFLATISATGLMMGNQLLVSIWTSGVMNWSLGADMILTALLIVTSISRCFVGIFGLVGDLGPVRYIYLLEGCVFITLALPAVRNFGVIGVLAASLAAHLAATMVISGRLASTLLDSMKPALHLASRTYGIMLSVIGIAILVNMLHLSFIVEIILSLLGVISVSPVAWLIVLPQRIRSSIMLKIKLSIRCYFFPHF
jgi:O-antigen/teichoic acid export membrane protein